MKIANIMNFVRQCEPRDKYLDSILVETTKRTIELVKEYGFDNTFLLQYDAVIDPEFTELFKREMDDKMELGLWLEIVQPMCEAVGLPWRSTRGWKWDWHVVPGFSMAYTPAERELLIDEAMNKFKSVYGFYPRTVGSWLIDTHTMNYLEKHYNIDMICICRDEVDTDAYTLIGGYFNQGYFPSRKNIFTPAQTKEMQSNIPIFRLLGPDPVHLYDRLKYFSSENQLPENKCSTIEPAWKSGQDPKIIEWYLKNFFTNEDLGFSYIQLGQENSFGYPNFIHHLKEQFEQLSKYDDVKVMKMCDTGAWFKDTYPSTPATAISGTSCWLEGDATQSTYYDCKNYTADLFRRKNRIFIRLLYLFNENIPEDYIDVDCKTWDATYENLPVMDTIMWDRENLNCGISLDEDAKSAFTFRKLDEGVLIAEWDDKSVIFYEDRLEINNCKVSFVKGADVSAEEINIDHPHSKTGKGAKSSAQINLSENRLNYLYKAAKYSLCCDVGRIEETEKTFEFISDNGKIVLSFER